MHYMHSLLVCYTNNGLVQHNVNLTKQHNNIRGMKTSNVQQLLSIFDIVIHCLRIRPITATQSQQPAQGKKKGPREGGTR